MKRDVYDAILETARELNINVTGHVGPLVKLPVLAALAAREQNRTYGRVYWYAAARYNSTITASVSDMNIWRKEPGKPFRLDEAKFRRL